MNIVMLAAYWRVGVCFWRDVKVGETRLFDCGGMQRRNLQCCPGWLQWWFAVGSGILRVREGERVRGSCRGRKEVTVVAVEVLGD